jgi:hypothetical protein
VQSRVWDLGQAVWQTSSGKMIADLEFETAIHSPSSTPPPDGLSACAVSCRFRTTLDAPHVIVGVAFSAIGRTEVWKVKPEPAYIHQLLLQDLSDDARDQVLQALAKAMDRGPEAAWRIIFPSFSVSINGLSLTEGAIEGRRVPPYEWLRRTFTLRTASAGDPPAERARGLEQLVGEEVDVAVSFESLVPKSLSSFRFSHRWLTHRSSCRVSVNGRLEYFLPSQRLAIGQTARVTPEASTQVHSVLFSIDDAVLPESSFEVRWQASPGA